MWTKILQTHARVESLIICDKLKKSKNEVNDFNKLHPCLLDTLVLKSSIT